MSLPGSLQDREYKKFSDVGSGLTALNVVEKGGFTVPPETTSFTVDYPTTTQEVYKFYSADSTLLKTITLNYLDDSKASITGGSAA